MHGRDENCARRFGYTPRNEKLLGRFRHRREIDIKLDFKENGRKLLSRSAWFRIGNRSRI
jgi:hypothetical protein